MRFILMCINIMIVKILGNEVDDFIVDYFRHKNVSSIVGFICSTYEDTFGLSKRFSSFNIGTSFVELKNSFGVYRMIRSERHKIGVVIDLRCYEKQDVYTMFTEAARNRMYDELHKWLAISSPTKNVSSLINDETFDLSTDFVMAVTSNSDNFKLYDIYNPFKDRGGKINITFLGTWVSNEGLEIVLTQNKYARRSNLNRLIWRVAYFTSKYKAPEVLLEDHLQDFQKTGTKDGLPKFGYSVVKHLSEMYNATIFLRQYGTWKKGDRSGPMSRALEFNEIDMTGSLISVIPEKLSMLKFVYPAWPFRTCFMFRTPQPDDIKIHEILGQFEIKVWYLIVLINLSLIIGFAITLRIDENNSSLMRYSNAVLTIFGCLCQQGSHLEMNQLSTRTIFYNSLLFSLLIYNYYSASVVSTRLSEPIFKMQDSLITLARSELSVASEPMIYFDFLMKDYGKGAEYFNSTKWQKVPLEERFMLPDKAMKRVQNGGFAYHTHPDVGYPYVNRMFTNREICELTEVHLGKLSYRSIAISYNSSFTEITKHGFAWISEVGIRKRQLIKWKSRRPRCREDILSASSITIKEFAPQLIIFIIGFLLSFFIFLGEIVVNSKTRTKLLSLPDVDETTVRSL